MPSKSPRPSRSSQNDGPLNGGQVPRAQSRRRSSRNSVGVSDLQLEDMRAGSLDGQGDSSSVTQRRASKRKRPTPTEKAHEEESEVETLSSSKKSKAAEASRGRQNKEQATTVLNQRHEGLVSPDEGHDSNEPNTSSGPTPESARDKLLQLFTVQNLPSHLLENPMWQDFLTHVAPAMEIPAPAEVDAESARMVESIRDKLTKLLSNAGTSIHISDAVLTLEDSTKMSATVVSWIDQEFQFNSFLAGFNFWPVKDTAVIASNVVLDVLKRYRIVGALGSRTTHESDANAASAANVFEAATKKSPKNKNNVLLQYSSFRLPKPIPPPKPAPIPSSSPYAYPWHPPGEQMRTVTPPKQIPKKTHDKQVDCIAHMLDSIVSAFMESLKWPSFVKAGLSPVWTEGPLESAEMDRNAEIMEKAMKEFSKTDALMKSVEIDPAVKALDLSAQKLDRWNFQSRLSKIPALEKLRIITRKANSSRSLNDRMREIVLRHQPWHGVSRLLEPNPERWDSLTNAIARLLDLESPVGTFIDDLNGEAMSSTELQVAHICPSLSAADWNMLTELSRVLRSFRSVAARVFGDGGRVHEILPTLHGLLSSLRQLEQKCREQGFQAKLKKARETLQAHFEAQAQSDIICLAYALRPDRRLTSLKAILESEEWGALRYREVESSLLSYLGAESFGSSSSTTFSSELWADPTFDLEGARLRKIDEERRAKQMRCAELLWLEDRSLDTPDHAETIDPLIYWKRSQNQYPKLARLVRAVYGAQATSIAPRQVLSTARKAVKEMPNVEDHGLVGRRVLLMHWFASQLDELPEGKPVVFKKTTHM